MKLPVKTALTSVLLIFATTGCDVDQTQDGELPSVDVDVEGGQLPEYDIDGPDIDVGTKKVEVTVPDIDVDLPEDEGDALEEADS